MLFQQTQQESRINVSYENFPGKFYCEDDFLTWRIENNLEVKIFTLPLLPFHTRYHFKL